MTSKYHNPADAAYENVFSKIVDSIHSHAIFTLDNTGVIKNWNSGAELITGWKKSQAIGKNFKILYTAEDQEKGVAAASLKHADKHGSFQIEANNLRNNGTLFLADISITTVCKDDKSIEYVIVTKDTTQRKKDEVEQIDANTLLRQEIYRRKATEAALKESNEELNAFATAAGHDLQEPLRMVVSYLQLIERRYRDSFDDDGKDFLNFAIDGATRMRALINDLVEYSRIDTLGKPLRKINANAVLKEVLTSMEVSISETGTTVTHDALPNIWSDEVQLNELFQNLIANAIKFGANDGNKLAVHVGVESKPKEYIFSVADTGPGIAKKDFSIIFLIFKQLGNKLQAEGSGIGLAICRKIVKRHKGQIWVESEVGKGAIFKFSIPRKEEHHE